MSEPNGENDIRGAEQQVSSSSPLHSGELALSIGDRVQSLAVDDSAKAVFLAWERLRILYNLLLAGLVFAFLYPMSRYTNWEYLLEGVVAANICYCVGPCAEGYLVLLGANRLAARALLFLSGVLLSRILALLALIPIFP